MTCRKINKHFSSIILLFILTILIIGFLSIGPPSSSGEDSEDGIEPRITNAVLHTNGTADVVLITQMQLYNNYEQSKLITLTTSPPTGKNTGITSEIHVRRIGNDKNNPTSYEITLQGDQGITIPILIAVNDSASADHYTIDISVETEAPAERDVVSVVIIVEEIYQMHIELVSSEAYKTIHPGQETEFEFVITNFGNINQIRTKPLLDYQSAYLFSTINTDYIELTPYKHWVSGSSAKFSVRFFSSFEAVDETIRITALPLTPDHQYPEDGPDTAQAIIRIETESRTETDPGQNVSMLPGVIITIKDYTFHLKEGNKDLITIDLLIRGRINYVTYEFEQSIHHIGTTLWTIYYKDGTIHNPGFIEFPKRGVNAVAKNQSVEIEEITEDWRLWEIHYQITLSMKDSERKKAWAQLSEIKSVILYVRAYTDPEGRNSGQQQVDITGTYLTQWNEILDYYYPPVHISYFLILYSTLGVLGFLYGLMFSGLSCERKRFRVDWDTGELK